MDIVQKLEILAKRVSHQDYNVVMDAIDEIQSLRATNNENNSKEATSDAN